MARSTRRQFLKHSLAASTAFSTFTIAGTKSSGRVLGANNVIRVGVAGIHGRGNDHIGGLSGDEGRRLGTQITYLIDPDSRLFAERVERIRESSGNVPKTVQDIRHALDDKDLDAVTVATPNHWHALITIWACQAGKDVYVEKPCSHNVFEGRAAVAAARKYDRIVQHGTQNRSSRHWNKVVALVRSGVYGKLLVSRGYASKTRGSIGFRPTKSPPPELDFNLWLGPVEEIPYHENLVHYNWHWFWPTGNGEIGNQGVHQMDIARWGIPGATLPQSVISLGGRFGYEDQGQTPNTQVAIYDFGETKLIFEVRGLVTPETGRVDNEFYCEQGAIIGGKFYPKGSDRGEPLADVELDVQNLDDHYGSFVAAIRSRRREDLNAELLDGHYSSALCHLGNISYRLGEQTSFEARSATLDENKDLKEELESLKEHLRGPNHLDLSGKTFQLGRKIRFDAESESIVGDDEAARLLTRHYREGFAVPSIA